MVKYSSFLFVASLCCFTILCVSAASANGKGDAAGTGVDPFNGNLKSVFEEMAKIEESSNPLITFFRDTTKKYIDDFEKDKKFIQDAVRKGTEMEKKIQSISHMLKNSTKPLPAELQSQIEEIGSHAATELTKLKEMENVNDIDGMQKSYKAKYTEIKKKLEELSKLALSEIAKGKEGASNLVSESSTAQGSNPFTEEAKTKLIEFIKTSVPVAFTMKKDEEAISKKMDVASSVLSEIHGDLTKLEQMEYHLLGAHKDLFKTDFAYLTRLSMVLIIFAIMFGMLF